MKILLYPFEEQFDVSALSVEFCDRQGFVSQMVGKEEINLTCGEVFISDHPEGLWVILGWFDSGQFDDFIADYASFEIVFSRLNNFVQHIVFCPSYEECSVLVDMVEEPEEVNVTFVQKIDSSHLNTETVQSLDIVHRSICKMDIDREITPEIKERMYLDTGFSRSEFSPRTKLQTKTYSTAIEGINHIVDVKSERIFCIKGTYSFNESLTKVPVYTPVPLFICLGKSIPWNSVTDATMIQLVLNCNQTRFNISKTVLRSILRKTHHEKLIVAGQIPGRIVSLVLGNARVKVSTRYKRHKLSKYGFSCEHGQKDKLVSPKLRFKSCTRKNFCN